MQPLLPEKESRNGTGDKMLAQATARPMSIPLGAAFRYPSAFDWYGCVRASVLQAFKQAPNAHPLRLGAWFATCANRLKRPAGGYPALESGLHPDTYFIDRTDRSSF
ncbi:hypothetical protein [Pseudomonas sp.]|uniref:hypothetical protein n=1 Tax=Pseudomonas sp. TaxID=306 RepID=UPI002601DD34|nr:hypothetical protein [Pseudomonas sp.]